MSGSAAGFIVHHLLVGGNDTKGRKRAMAAFQWLDHLRHGEPMEIGESENFENRFMTAQEVAMKVKEDFELRKGRLFRCNLHEILFGVFLCGAPLWFGACVRGLFVFIVFKTHFLS